MRGTPWPCGSSSPSPSSSSRTLLRGDLGGLLHRLDLQRQLHLVADEQAARLQRLVPLEPEVLAVDGSGCDEPGALAAPGVLAAPLVGDIQDHGLGDAVDGEVAGDPITIPGRDLDVPAAEGGGRLLLDVEEVE